jgi:hypothetical protein
MEWRGSEGQKTVASRRAGLGDTVQFARFATIMAARGGQITLAVQPPLVGLLGSAGWNVTVNDGAALSGFDFELPLMSLPAVLGINEDTIPADVPYLAPIPKNCDVGERLETNGFKIGIVWHRCLRWLGYVSSACKSTTVGRRSMASRHGSRSSRPPTMELRAPARVGAITIFRVRSSFSVIFAAEARERSRAYNGGCSGPFWT